MGIIAISRNQVLSVYLASTMLSFFFPSSISIMVQIPQQASLPPLDEKKSYCV